MADLIKFKKGLQANSPNLNLAEPALFTDQGNERLAIGGTQGNVLLPNQNDLDEIVDKIGVLSTLNTTDKTDLVSAINENTSSLADNTKIYVNVLSRGCTTQIEDATINRTIIQRLIDDNENIIIPVKIPIDGKIIITPSYSGKTISGAGSGSLLMVTSGSNIFEFSKTYQTTVSKVTIKDITLSYSQQQTVSGDAIYFKSAQADGWGYHHNKFNGVTIRNAYNGINSDGIDPVWNCDFDIVMYDIYNKAVYLVNVTQLGLTFKLRVLNYTLRDQGYNNGTRCVHVNGEQHYYYLDIEDWKGEIFLVESGLVKIDMVHFERIQNSNSYDYMIGVGSASMVVDIVRLYGCTITSGGYFTIFRLITSSSQLILNKLQSQSNTFPSTINACKLDHLSGSAQINNSDISAIYGYTGYDPYNSRYVTVDGNPFNEWRKYSSAPTFDVTKAERFYNSSPSSYVGWIAIANGYNATNVGITVNTTAYNGTVSIASGSISNLKVGDGIYIGSSSTMQIITSISTNSFSVSNYEAITTSETGVAITRATPAQVLKTFGAIV